jgi:YhcH/YjgK/YiaL family protein
MILDSIENSGLYESIHPRFKRAFEYLRSTDLKELPFGKIELEGSDLVVNVVEMNGKTVDMAKVETHNRFIDIQIPIGAAETMGWISANKLKHVTEPYNADKDITFFADKASNLVLIQPFEFAVFFPGDGHQPGIGEGTYKKIIVKILA